MLEAGARFRAPCPSRAPPPTKGKVRGWRGSAQSSQAGEGGEGRGTGTPALLVVLLYWLACPPALSSPEGACAAARGDTHVGGQVGVELGGPHESGSQEEPPCSPPPPRMLWKASGQMGL